MNNILEATLQIKDKNMIWDNKVQEKIFKKRKSLFYHNRLPRRRKPPTKKHLRQMTALTPVNEN